MEKPFAGKTILIAIPNHFGLPQRFKENLEYLGFTVFLLDHNAKKTKLSIQNYTIHAYKKILKNDTTHKQSILNKMAEKHQIPYIQSLPNVDYALFVRPDLFSKKVVTTAREKSKKTVAYQWDGMERYPLAKRYIDLFDVFYVFDKADLQLHPKLRLTTNFYFDDIWPEKEIVEKSVYFVGTLMRERINQLNLLTEYFERNHIKCNIFLITNKRRISNLNPTIKKLENGFNFEENLRKVLKSFIVLDFKSNFHNGLSLRVFESVGFEIKLVTNNELVKKTDFYNENNIFLFSERPLSDLDSFLAKPYQKLSEHIRQKYSFTNWINSLLNF